MLKKVEKTAKNLNEAIELAAADLGVSPDEVGYEIIRESNKGLMRFLLGSEVEISAWIKAEKEKEEKTFKKAKKEVKEDKPEVKTETEKPVSKKKVFEQTEEIKTVEEEKSVTKAKRRDDEEEIVIPKEAVDDAKYFISEMLEKIGLKADLNVRLEKNEIKIVISGEKMGLLIGNHGKTLDSIQFLTSLYVNRKKGHFIKISVDTENYRKKREETLSNLARSLARNVVKNQKSASLEPMSANQRRIIHLTLQNNPAVKTYSVGEEPRRRVVIAPAAPKAKAEDDE